MSVHGRPPLSTNKQRADYRTLRRRRAAPATTALSANSIKIRLSLALFTPVGGNCTAAVGVGRGGAVVTGGTGNVVPTGAEVAVGVV